MGSGLPEDPRGPSVQPIDSSGSPGELGSRQLLMSHRPHPEHMNINQHRSIAMQASLIVSTSECMHPCCVFLAFMICTNAFIIQNFAIAMVDSHVLCCKCPSLGIDHIAMRIKARECTESQSTAKLQRLGGHSWCSANSMYTCHYCLHPSPASSTFNKQDPSAAPFLSMSAHDLRPDRDDKKTLLWYINLQARLEGMIAASILRSCNAHSFGKMVIINGLRSVRGPGPLGK